MATDWLSNIEFIRGFSMVCRVDQRAVVCGGGAHLNMMGTREISAQAVGVAR